MANTKKRAFTLAEMMVVMLIMTVVLAAAAPLMTARMRGAGTDTTNSSPWQWTSDGSGDAYFGPGEGHRAIIGANTPSGTNARLIINTTDSAPTHIAFKKDNSFLGRLSIDANKNLAFGTTSSTGAENTVAIGHNVYAYGNNSVVIGGGSNEIISNGDNSVVIGPYVDCPSSNAICIGDGSTINGSTSTKSVAIGYLADGSGKSSIAIGENSAVAGGTNAIAIGTDAGAATSSTNSVAIGTQASANHINSVAIGYKATATEDNQIVLGCAGDATGCTPPKVVINGDLEVKGDFSFPNGLNLSGTSITLGNGSFIYDKNGNALSQPHGNQNGWSPFESDRRLKNVGLENKAGLEKIKELKVFNYTYKKDEQKIPHVGVIAQDLQKVFPDAVSKGDDGFFRIRMEDMFFAVVNAIKELDNKLTNFIEQVKRENTQLKQDVKQLQAENAELRARLDKLEAKMK